MPKMRDLRTVGADYPFTGPTNCSISQRVPAPAAALFRCLEDGPAWKEWLGIEVDWTSERPFGVGTTRTVKNRAATIDEVFVAWENGRRMTFFFERASLPVAAFAEDYLIDPRGDDACLLTWSYAYEWRGPLAPVASRLFGIGFKIQATRALRKLAKLLEADGARWST